MNPTRRERNRAARRMKRAVFQNYMVLRGWVPVQLNAQWGIYNYSENRLVLRRWEQAAGQGKWTCTGIQLTAPFNGTEVTWGVIQRRWVYDLRSAAIQKGWL